MRLFKKSQKYTEEDKFRAEGLNWLLKNASVDNPVVQEMLVQNIKQSSSFIEHLEILIDYKNMKFLVFLKITLLGKLLQNRNKLSQLVVNIIQMGFPQYSVKIWFKEKEWQALVKKLTS